MLTNWKNQHDVARDFANSVRLIVLICMQRWCCKPCLECTKPYNSFYRYFIARLPNITIKYNNWKKLGNCITAKHFIAETTQNLYIDQKLKEFTKSAKDYINRELLRCMRYQFSSPVTWVQMSHVSYYFAIVMKLEIVFSVVLFTLSC